MIQNNVFVVLMKHIWQINNVTLIVLMVIMIHLMQCKEINVFHVLLHVQNVVAQNVMIVEILIT